MNIKMIGVLALLFIVDMVLRKRFPQAWFRLQFPINIIASGLSLVMIVFTVIGAYQVVASDVSTTSKVFFALFSMVFIAVFVWANYRFWGEWYRKHKSD